MRERRRRGAAACGRAVAAGEANLNFSTAVAQVEFSRNQTSNGVDGPGRALKLEPPMMAMASGK